MKSNVWIGMVFGMFLGGLCVLAVSKPFAKTMAQESSSSSQSSIVMDQIATPEDLDLLRQDLRAKKQQLIGENLPLSDAEAEKFWPVYHHYSDDLREIGNEKFGLLKDYAEKWGDMSDQDALIYIRRWLEVDQKVQALRLQYVPVVSQILPGKKTATFFQLDRRISMMMDVQLSSQIPLVQGKKK